MTEAVHRSTASPSGYFSDMRWSAQAITKAPWLLLLTLAIIAAYEASILLAPTALASWLLFATSIILAGFVGTQRVWFLHILRGGEVINPRKVLSLTRSFVGRFILLGCVSGILLFPVFVVVLLIEPRPRSGKLHVPVGGTIAILAVLLLLDAAGTFVVPALALSCRSVKVAVREGLRLVKRTWPSSAWYVCAPGITITAFTTAFNRSVIGVWPAFVLAVLGGAIALWFKGAIVAYYTRIAAVPGDDGSAYL